MKEMMKERENGLWIKDVWFLLKAAGAMALALLFFLEVVAFVYFTPEQRSAEADYYAYQCELAGVELD